MRIAIILAAAGFVVMLIVRLPARWLTPLLPHGAHCRQLDGSAWNGSCGGLTNGIMPVGDLNWTLHPLQLLQGRLGATIDLNNGAGYLRGDVARGFGGAVHGRNLSLDLSLTSALVSSFPAGARARLSGKLARLEWSGKFLTELQGDLVVQDLVDSAGEPLGSYHATFGPGTAGVVHDTGGPLALDATLQLTHDPGYVIEGLVAARPSASAAFTEQLRYLGAPDADGRRHFSLAGTF